MISTDNRVAKKAQPAIINSISVNEYFKLQKKINDENLDLQEEIYKKQFHGTVCSHRSAKPIRN